MYIKKFYVAFFSLCILFKLFGESDFSHADTQWAIVGAGPAGITCLGLLLDLGIPADQIMWIDPEFNVGRIGKYYQHVPANAKTKVFFEFLNACKAFKQCAHAEIEALLNLDLDKEYPLEVVVKPLQAITDNLCIQIQKKQTYLTALDFKDNVWQVRMNSGEKITAAHVILAVGCIPKTLPYACKTTIPLDLALDKTTLTSLIEPQDTIAVIGSAHSAILILKHLYELSVARILNFYLHEPEFHHPENQLGGITAQWAKEVLLSKSPPANIVRIFNTENSRKSWLPLATKIIYAIGFEPKIPPINGSTEISYDESSGIIAPRLFGIGIAFPEKYIDDQGNKVSKIGLLNFMEYATKVMPLWIAEKDHYSRFISYEELFNIMQL